MVHLAPTWMFIQLDCLNLVNTIFELTHNRLWGKGGINRIHLGHHVHAKVILFEHRILVYFVIMGCFCKVIKTYKIYNVANLWPPPELSFNSSSSAPALMGCNTYQRPMGSKRSVTSWRRSPWQQLLARFGTCYGLCWNLKPTFVKVTTLWIVNSSCKCHYHGIGIRVELTMNASTSHPIPTYLCQHNSHTNWMYTPRAYRCQHQLTFPQRCFAQSYCP
jgi:hypothetical protein